MEQALRAALLADGDVAALIGARLYPVVAAQGAAVPFAVYRRVSGQPVYAYKGDAGLTESRAQIDCYGGTYAQAKALARAVTAALSGKAVDGIQGAFLLDERDLSDENASAGNRRFRVSLDFNLWHPQ